MEMEFQVGEAFQLNSASLQVLLHKAQGLGSDDPFLCEPFASAVWADNAKEPNEHRLARARGSREADLLNANLIPSIRDVHCALAIGGGEAGKSVLTETELDL